MAVSQDEIDNMLKDTEEANQFSDNMTEIVKPAVEVGTTSFPDMEHSDDSTPLPALDPKMELLYDLQLPVSIELGKTNMLIRDILRLGRGSVIEFDKLVSEPVDVLINSKKVAEGEVVVIDKHFGIRITTLVGPADRLRSLKK
ncbi:MAG: flagellar motor switch protein FliN [FCB group bacterium]|jgi:flagellar motor switch protein FliN/FliY